MPMRAMMLMQNTWAEHASLIAAMRVGGPSADVRTLSSRSAVLSACMLAAHRPHLVVAEGTGSGAIVAMFYRLLFRRSRLLVRLAGTEGRRSLVRRLVLGQADGVLSDEDSAEFIVQSRDPAPRVFRLAAPLGLEPFLACPLTRTGDAIHRLIFAGPLSPQSGAADVTLCVAAWAESNPDRSVEIWWLGEGDLAGVLDAQPLPDNMTQRFLGALDPEQAAQAFAQCGILVLPPRRSPEPSPVAAALAAGLVVVHSERETQTFSIPAGAGVGWAFDPRRPDDMLRAIGEALAAPAEVLAALGAAGRDHVTHAAATGMTDRLRGMLATVMQGAMPRPSTTGLEAGPQAAMEPR